MTRKNIHILMVILICGVIWSCSEKATEFSSVAYGEVIDSFIVFANDDTSLVYDTYIRDGLFARPAFIHRNFGTAPLCRIEWEPNKPPNEDWHTTYGLIGFDFSGFPYASNTIDSAFCILDIASLSEDSAWLALQPVLKRWGEGTKDDAQATTGECTFADSMFPDAWAAPGATGVGDVGPISDSQWVVTKASYGKAVHWDVTQDAIDWLDDTTSFHGWKIKAVSYDTNYVYDFHLASKDYADAAPERNGPKLVIYYTVAEAAGQMIIID